MTPLKKQTMIQKDRYLKCASVILGTLMLTFLFNTAQAASQRCHQLEDRDQKNLCLAVTEKRSSRCRPITSLDSRHFCLAFVDNNPTRCYSIRNKDSRNICLALTKERS